MKDNRYDVNNDLDQEDIYKETVKMNSEEMNTNIDKDSLADEGTDDVYIEEQKESAGSVIKDWLKSIVIAVAVALLIRAFLFQPTRVEGSSMNNTLESDDRVVLNKISMKLKALDRGDIVVMEFNEDSDYIKRVVGLPGDYVQIIDGQVYINGNLYEEDYIYGDYTMTDAQFEWQLSDTEYFLMGDNRQPYGSTDSRYFGPVDIERIEGTVSFRYFPIESFGVIN